jgi:hypothetical protein
MSEDKVDQTTEEDRRRFLKLAKDLGIGVGVITLALARPDYAAASGLDRRGEDDQGEDEQ